MNRLSLHPAREAERTETSDVTPEHPNKDDALQCDAATGAKTATPCSIPFPEKGPVKIARPEEVDLYAVGNVPQEGPQIVHFKGDWGKNGKRKTRLQKTLSKWFSKFKKEGKARQKKRRQYGVRDPSACPNIRR